ncbi:hypothetical protein HDR60_03950 [bacterium]|nr:hypothetical protein [bacterium]
MFRYIITYKLDTEKNEDSYNQRLKNLKEFLQEEAIKINDIPQYIEDSTTSTIYLKSSNILYNETNKIGIIYDIIQNKILVDEDIVKFHKLVNKNNIVILETIKYIKNNKCYIDENSLSILK